MCEPSLADLDRRFLNVAIGGGFLTLAEVMAAMRRHIRRREGRGPIRTVAGLAFEEGLMGAAEIEMVLGAVFAGQGSRSPGVLWEGAAHVRDGSAKEGSDG